MSTQDQPAHNLINIEDYKKGKRVNKSGFGVLLSIEEKKTGNLYYAKIIDCEDDEEKVNQMINEKFKDIITFKHPTIINIIGYSKKDFQDENNIGIIIEKANNGSLADVIKSFQEKNDPKQYSNTNRQIIMAGIARGMKLLHEKNVIHCDLKSRNILLDENYKPIITDFYLSNFVKISKSLNQNQFKGNLPYFAPELIVESPYDKKIDVYAFGILMIEIINDSFAYPELQNDQLSELAFKNKIVHENYRPELNKNISQSLKQLINKCISSDPNERPDFEEIFNKIAFCDDVEPGTTTKKYMLDNIDIQKYKEYISEISDPNEQLLYKLSTLKDENKELKDTIINLKTEKENCNQKIQNLENEIENLTKNLNETTIKLDEMTSRVAEFERLQYGNKCLKDRNLSYVTTMTNFKDEIRALSSSNELLKEEKEEQSKQHSHSYKH